MVLTSTFPGARCEHDQKSATNDQRDLKNESRRLGSAEAAEQMGLTRTQLLIQVANRKITINSQEKMILGE
ncbi:hypothetical protein MiSe_78310 [Microseira wollei NIES-4236]|uniref:Uncharacterized protein n=1 Tax=Microseira wollei NIES-4236 TaxID=2530354 RepID=A0AAV3XMU7_9CYAN|nr:hypothetical protein MiSe_78310 [Microseira wollei NIES-4236]